MHTWLTGRRPYTSDFHVLTACFTSASVTIPLPVCCFSRDQNRSKSRGSILTTGLVNGWGAMAAGRRCTNLSTLNISRATTFISLALFSTWLASNLQQTPKWSKVSPPAYRHLNPVSSMPPHKPWCRGGENAYNRVFSGNLVCTICYAYAMYIWMSG